jgi:ABC-type polysaccharide/polyol phosphate transport system ATPase subunit
MHALSFENVSKYFKRHSGQMLLRDRLTHLFRPAAREPFWALRDITFSVENGQSLAVIGSNGAGKSTLLNIATGLCRPSSGKANVSGRVSPLLELAAGFHPDLTGAENVMVNAALLGLTRAEVSKHFEEIVDFSGVGDFINEPLRTYSSGMMMRLAFAVAINVNADILIIDEVLGVGDHAFLEKCENRIRQFRRDGKTMLCVSHSLETLESLCDQAIWLDHGRLLKKGPIKEVITAYTGAAGPAGSAARHPLATPTA